MTQHQNLVTSSVQIIPTLSSLGVVDIYLRVTIYIAYRYIILKFCVLFYHHSLFICPDILELKECSRSLARQEVVISRKWYKMKTWLPLV